MVSITCHYLLGSFRCDGPSLAQMVQLSLSQAPSNAQTHVHAYVSKRMGWHPRAAMFLYVNPGDQCLTAHLSTLKQGDIIPWPRMEHYTGWWLSPTPLKNMSSSVGIIIPN